MTINLIGLTQVKESMEMFHLMVQDIKDNGSMQITLQKHWFLQMQNWSNNSSFDEIHVIVLMKMVRLQVYLRKILEVFEGLSMASDAKDADGNSNYYVDKIRYNSNYIFWTNHDSGTSEAGNTFAAGAVFTRQ